MTYGEKIKIARIAKGMTQEELGKLVGVQKSAVAKWENGRVPNIKLETKIALSKILDISPIDTPYPIQEGIKSQKYDQVMKLLAFASPEQIDDVIKYIRFVLQDK